MINPKNKRQIFFRFSTYILSLKTAKKMKDDFSFNFSLSALKNFLFEKNIKLKDVDKIENLYEKGTREEFDTKLRRIEIKISEKVTNKGE